MIGVIFRLLITLPLFLLFAACATDHQSVDLYSSKKTFIFLSASKITNNMQGGEDQVYYIPKHSIYTQPKDMPSIAVQAKYLRHHSTSAVMLIGNTDSGGSREYNFALGWQYAQAVANILLEEGVLPNQINVVSYGEENSIDLWHNEEAGSPYRRVILHYYENS